MGLPGPERPGPRTPEPGAGWPPLSSDEGAVDLRPCPGVSASALCCLLGDPCGQGQSTQSGCLQLEPENPAGVSGIDCLARSPAVQVSVSAYLMRKLWARAAGSETGGSCR